MSYLFWLSDEQMARFEPYFPTVAWQTAGR